MNAFLKSINSQRGFGLMDLIIAMVILSITILAGTAVLVSSLRTQSNAVLQAKAQDLAHDKINEYAAKDFVNIALDQNGLTAGVVPKWEYYNYDRSASPADNSIPAQLTASGSNYIPPISTVDDYQIYTYVSCHTNNSPCSSAKTIRLVVARGNQARTAEGLYSLVRVVYAGGA